LDREDSLLDDREERFYSMQIRTGMRSSWLAAAAAVLVTGLLALLPSGCGGGGGETLPVVPTPTPVGATPTPTPVGTAAFKVKIDWGARSRVVGLSSALSARITLVNGDPAGGDISWVVNRPAGTASVLQSYDSPRKAKVGNFILRVDFYANTDATPESSKVGFAQASASVLNDGTLTVTISTYTGVQSVEIIAGQTVAVGDTLDLAFQAKNSDGQTVAVTRGSVFFTVVADTANLESVNGGSAVKGLHPVSAMVTAAIDNATSAPTLVRVTSTTTVAVTPTSGDLGSEAPLDLTAVVTNAPSGTGNNEVTWTIQGGAGAQNGNLTSVTGTSVRYLAPKVVNGEVRNITLVATSKYDTSKTITVPIKVSATTAVVITPSPVSLSWEESVSLSAVVNNISSLIPAGDARREVKWELVKDGTNPVGTLVVDTTDANKAVYTAPKRDATITVRAISNYDSTVIGVVTITVKSTVTVTVTSPNPLVDPLRLSVNKVQNFVTSISNIPLGKDGSQTWTITGPAGEPNTGGIYGTIVPTSTTTARYTAPATQPGAGNARIIATSNYDPNANRIINIQIIGGTLDVRID
jgi:hypothetical protein